MTSMNPHRWRRSGVPRSIGGHRPQRRLCGRDSHERVAGTRQAAVGPAALRRAARHADGGHDRLGFSGRAGPRPDAHRDSRDRHDGGLLEAARPRRLCRAPPKTHRCARAESHAREVLLPSRYVPCLLVVLASLASERAVAQCDGQIVSAIDVVSHAPSFLRLPRPLRTLARGVGLHTTTKPAVISHLLLLEVGRPCTERLRAESERILRFQPFLADASVRAVPDGQGGVRIEVETIDEIPTVFALRWHDGGPAALRVGNGNVGGRGVYLAVRGERGFAYRNGIGMQLVASQVFARPYTLALVAGRSEEN